MKIYTVSDVLDYRIAESDCKAVYVIYDSENFPLYVGQSKDVCLRLRQHINSAQALPDGIGAEIVRSGPLEREMIKRLRPAINIVHN